MGPWGVQFSGGIRFGSQKGINTNHLRSTTPTASVIHSKSLVGWFEPIRKGGKSMNDDGTGNLTHVGKIKIIKEKKKHNWFKYSDIFESIGHVAPEKIHQLQAAEINPPFKAAPNDPLSPGTQAQPCLAHNARSRCSSQLSRSTWCFHGFGDQYSAPCHLTQIEVMVAFSGYINLPTYKWIPSTLVLVWRINLLNWSYLGWLPPLHVWFWLIKCRVPILYLYQSLLNISRLIRFIK